MNTNELISMVTERRNFLEKNLKTNAKDYFNVFKKELAESLPKKWRYAYSKKIGITIEEISESGFTTGGIWALNEDDTYEDYFLTPFDDYEDFIYGSFGKEDLSAFVNYLKDLGFKVFVNQDKNLVPFIEID